MNPAERPHRSQHTLLFLALVAGLSALLARSGAAFKAGNQVVLSFPTLPAAGDSVFADLAPEDVEALLATYEGASEEREVQETEAAGPPGLEVWSGGSSPPLAAAGGCEHEDTSDWASQRACGAWQPSGVHPNLLLSGDSAAFAALGHFFERMEAGGAAAHVLHFGDSQIEGDRITSELRHAFQARWGGNGPGYLSAVPQVQVPAFHQTATGWNRHTLFGQADASVGHERFGLLATLGRWEARTEPQDWTDPIVLKQRNMGHAGNRVWPALHVLAGPLNEDSVAAEITCDSMTYINWIARDSISSSLHVALPSPCRTLAIRFAIPCPDINAIGLFGDSGVVVHNIPMRGSSGTLFKKADRAHWLAQVGGQDVALVLLQYGGNAVPYLEDASEAERYAGWLAAQIQLFRTALPGVPIALIGPADMSTKDGLHFVTDPRLLHVRAALMAMAQREHVLYWDLFAVMGGHQAMPAWVQAEPPLAAADHIHFTGRGARRVGRLLGDAFAAELRLWQRARSGTTSALEVPMNPLNAP
jgi:lysophospholipase L1-like esterase